MVGNRRKLRHEPPVRELADRRFKFWWSTLRRPPDQHTSAQAEPGRWRAWTPCFPAAATCGSARAWMTCEVQHRQLEMSCVRRGRSGHSGCCGGDLDGLLLPGADRRGMATWLGHWHTYKLHSPLHGLRRLLTPLPNTSLAVWQGGLIWKAKSRDIWPVVEGHARSFQTVHSSFSQIRFIPPLALCSTNMLPPQPDAGSDSRQGTAPKGGASAV